MKKNKPLGEASSLLSPKKRRQVAQWIRDGLSAPGVKESHCDFFFTDAGHPCLVCALGAAVVGKYKGNLEKVEKLFRGYQNGNYFSFSAKSLGIPWGVADTIDDLHCLNSKKAKTIATMLEKGTL